MYKTDCTRHVLFNFTLHLDTFKFTVETTHDQYVYAARSNRVPQANLIPPGAPLFSLQFRYDVNSPYKFHRGPWFTLMERSYASEKEMIEELITLKNHFWCHHCEKGLFFPNSCPEHVEGEEEVEEEEEEKDED